jgi:hypothetical protein
MVTLRRGQGLPGHGGAGFGQGLDGGHAMGPFSKKVAIIARASATRHFGSCSPPCVFRMSQAIWHDPSSCLGAQCEVPNLSGSSHHPAIDHPWSQP